MKIQDKLKEALLARGETIIPNRSSKYIVMTCSDVPANLPESWQGRQVVYYLGKAGALRRGPSITDSYPVLELTRKRLLEGLPGIKLI